MLHERKRLWFCTVFVAMVCYAVPYMNSVFHLLFTLSMAAVFYPSEKVLALCDDSEPLKKHDERVEQLYKSYY